MRLSLYIFALCLVTLCLRPPLTLSQTGNPAPPGDEDGLLKAIAESAPGGTEQAAQLLLDGNARLVTPRLWEGLVNEGGRANGRAEFERALFFYGMARRVAVQLGDQKKEAASLYNAGRVHTNQWKIDEAVGDYRQSSDIYKAAGAAPEVAYVLADLAELYLYQPNYQLAKETAEEALAVAARLPPGPVKRPDATASALATLGAVYKWEGNYDRALEYLQRALVIYQDLKERKLVPEKYVADVQAEVARVYRMGGDYRQSLYYFNQAINIAKAIGDDLFLADVVNSLGVLYMEQRDYQKAAALFNQSLAIHAAAHDDQQVAVQLLNLGVTEQRQANYDKALQYFKESYAKSEARGYRGGLIAAGAGVGTVLRQQGDYAEALAWLNRSAALAEQAKDQTRIAEIYWQRAEAHLAAGDLPAAIETAQKALQMARQNRFPNLTYLSAAVLGRAYLARGELARAAESFSEAIHQIEVSRDYVAGAEQEALFFFDDKVEVYHGMVEVMAGRSRWADALSFAEQAKGRVLLDVMREGKADVAKAMTAPEKEEAQRLNRAITEVNGRLRAERAKAAPDDTLLRQLYAQLDAARVKYESFQNTLFASHPDLKARRGRTSPPALNEIDLAPDGRSAYLEYVVTKGQTFLFVIKRKKDGGEVQIKCYPLGLGAEELARRVEVVHKAMADRNPAFAPAARQLYEQLIQPAATELAGIERLCIIPDGVLWEVPFQALLSPKGRFLLEEYRLNYAPSLGVLREMARRRDAAAPPGSLIALGNPAVADAGPPAPESRGAGAALASLPEAEAEVKSIVGLYGAPRSKALTGSEATEKSFKALAPSYRTIHLATHAVLDDRHPTYSYLLLAKTGDEAENDGLLEAREIMDMKLHADLAVLSACETARGRVGSGEGVIGTAWAFFVAGCRTTMVSQWKVSSASTAKLMLAFYRDLNASGGRDKAESLRRASLELMKDPRYRHPFYWAGFILVGSEK